jgi:glutamyl-tRNA reductase
LDKGRKFAPTIHALKDKLNAIKKSELIFRKISDFNLEQAEIISARIIQKITTHFANHLKMTIPWWMKASSGLKSFKIGVDVK